MHIKPTLSNYESHSIDAVFDAMFEQEKEKADKPIQPVIDSTQQTTMIENSSSVDNDDNNLISIINSMDEEKLPTQTPEIVQHKHQHNYICQVIHLILLIHHHIHKTEQNKHHYYY